MGDFFMETSPQLQFRGNYVIGNVGNNGKGNLRRRFGYTLLAISTLIIGNNISVVSDIWLKPILGCGSTIESQLSIALTLHENPDDKCTHTLSPIGVPAKRS
jgi:hypothetical protein